MLVDRFDVAADAVALLELFKILLTLQELYLLELSGLQVFKTCDSFAGTDARTDGRPAQRFIVFLYFDRFLSEKHFSSFLADRHFAVHISALLSFTDDDKIKDVMFYADPEVLLRKNVLLFFIEEFLSIAFL